MIVLTNTDKIAAFEQLMHTLQAIKHKYSGLCAALEHSLECGWIKQEMYEYIKCLIKKELKELNANGGKNIWLFSSDGIAPRIAWCEERIKELQELQDL